MFLAVMCLAIGAIGLAVRAQSGVSLEGSFTADAQTQAIEFNLPDAVTSPQEIYFRTWSHSGGMNLAGDTIAAGGFDPLLILANLVPEARGLDSTSGTGLDAWLSQSTGTFPVVDPLAAGTYRLHLEQNAQTLGGLSPHWAVDLVAPGLDLDFNANVLLGVTPGTPGIRKATVMGADTSWNNTGIFYVGYTGDGVLNVRNGGAVSNNRGFLGRFSGSTGNASVTGAGSTWNNIDDLQVGFDGNGTLNIQSGGYVSSPFSFIGSRVGSTGLVNVNFAGALWDAQNLTVAGSGMGNLNVGNAARVNSTSGTIGDNAGSVGEVLVIAPNSLWNNTSDLTVGRAGQGSMRVQFGGRVDSATGFIARETGSKGNASIQDLNSIWENTGDLYVGGSSTASGGAGTLSVSGNGTVVVGGALKIWPTGQLNISTGTIETQSLDIEQANSLSHLGGTLRVKGGVAGTFFGLSEFVINGPNGASGPVFELDNATYHLSRDLIVARTQKGELRVVNGGIVNTDFGNIGEQTGSVGFATVVEEGSLWDNANGFLIVGDKGAGTLQIAAGGRVNSFVVGMGHQGNGSGVVNVTGAGSLWQNTDFLLVGAAGDGTLNVMEGGRVNSADGEIAVEIGSTGIATVSGAGAVWNNAGNLFVGGSGTSPGGEGAVNIQPDGEVLVGGTLKIWNTGDVNLDGGTLSVANLDKPSVPNLNINSGTLNLTSGDLA
ncbi:MAG: hypothetical protein ACYTGQ_03415, partial [Planctomycetota bacterium]